VPVPALLFPLLLQTLWQGYRTKRPGTCLTIHFPLDFTEASSLRLLTYSSPTSQGEHSHTKALHSLMNHSLCSETGLLVLQLAVGNFCSHVLFICSVHPPCRSDYHNNLQCNLFNSTRCTGQCAIHFTLMWTVQAKAMVALSHRLLILGKLLPLL